KKTVPLTKKTDPVVKDESKPVNTTSSTDSRSISSLSFPAGGYFSAEYNEAGKTINGQAGTFKSSSGWEDGKYYALMNNVQVGTIVKITDQGTGKSVFAKVLGQLPDMRESAGLMVRLSNAAAAELGEAEAKF